MKKLIFIIICLFSQQSLEAQDMRFYRYDQDLLTQQFHKSRRSAFRDSMPDNSIAIFFANPARNRSNDNDYDYHQDPNFFYLTGFTEPNSVLVISKTPVDILGVKTEEAIFVPDRDPASETWNGRRAGKEGAMEMLGIRSVFLASEFAKVKIDYASFSRVLYSLPQGVVDDRLDPNDLYDLVEAFRTHASLPLENGDSRRGIFILTSLREIKQQEEMVLLRKAIDMSCEAHREMMRATRPGMSEYDVEAIGEYVFARGGAEGVGYSSICGGGENSVILHYTRNRKKLADGDMILLDMGAEYHGYTADITRTFPVNGKFTEAQKILYELVLKAQQAGIEACRPGNAFQDPHRAAMEIIRQGLLDLEITRRPEDARRYFMHATSHYLGLDVHDPGTFGALREGNVITVEPGIYIAEGSPCDPKWWNIGIRIEDDILITKDGYENLSKSLVKTISEIETLMKETPEFVK